MYPQSPRTSFVSDQKIVNSILSERGACSPSVYPNSSNDSFDRIRNKYIYTSNTYKYNTPSKITSLNYVHSQQCDESRELTLKAFPEISLQESSEKFYNETLDYPTEKNTIETFLEQNHVNNTQIGNLITSDIRFNSDKLINIIYKKQNEIQLLKLQYDEIKKRELEWEKRKESSIAEKNEMRTTIVNLKNLINDLKNKQKHEISILTHQLENANNRTNCRQISQLINILSEIKQSISKFNKAQNNLNISMEIEKLSSIVQELDLQLEINNELEYNIQEKNQLIDLISTISSNSFISNDFSEDNEDIKQMNIYLFDQVQILKFKLRKLKNFNKENILRAIKLLEKLEKIENVSHPIIYEIKNSIKNCIYNKQDIL